MSAIENLTTPLEIDTHLAELSREAARLNQRVASAAASILHSAGARRRYYGKTQTWDMTFDEATTKLSLITTNHDEPGYKIREAADALAKYDAANAALDAKVAEIHKANKLYTGWSRFFLVTSSSGHIHSSMYCSTCRPTTTYGWLPQLSGKTEADAVKICGPALCSVCFPTAPLDHQAQKLSKKQVEDILAGREVTHAPKKASCPGSGQYAPAIRPGSMTEYCHCPACGKTVARTGTGKVRQHEAKA